LTSSRLMKKVLDKMSTEPMNYRQLERRTKRHGSNLRRILKDMESLGLVEKVDIKSDKFRIGWRKKVNI